MNDGAALARAAICSETRSKSEVVDASGGTEISGSCEEMDGARPRPELSWLFAANLVIDSGALDEVGCTGDEVAFG